MRWSSVSILVCLIALSGPAKLKAEPAGSTAPSFELVTFGGEAYSNESLKGRSTLLVFWAPWCNVCQRDLPLLGEFSRHDKPAQLGILSIGFADTRANVERFVKEQAVTFPFPSAYDEDRWMAQAFKVNATPTYVLLDAEGSVVLIHRGGGVLQNLQFREFLAAFKNEDRAGRGRVPSASAR